MVGTNLYYAKDEKGKSRSGRKTIEISARGCNGLKLGIIWSKKKGKMVMEIKHGAMQKSYEEQLNEYGYTLGSEKKIELFEKIKFSYNMLSIHGFLTEREKREVAHKIAKRIKDTMLPTFRKDDTK
ncbi:MAG: hypothetical protein ACLTBR_03165 [Anaerostipes sp.]|uniref:hypothetical protein n=1 Tax=Anaerostipes sp. TaxID=1872530 RepID=UPI003991E133